MTGALAWARLSYRQQRWELLLVLLAGVGAAAGMVWLASTLDAMRAANPECLAGVGGGFVGVQGEGPAAACQAIATEYYEAEGWASNLQNLAWAAPFGMGVILGAPLVAREIDGRTAQLAWSLSPSRVSWLVRRIAFVSLFGLALLAILAITSEILAAAILPERTLGEDFVWFGRRGLPVVARGAGAIMVGILVGAIVGHVLPAVLASMVVICLVFVGLSLGHDQWNRAEATVQPRNLDAAVPPVAELTSLGVAYGIETVDGEFLTYGEAFDRGLEPNYSGEDGKVYESEADIAADRFIGHDAWLMIPGERYPELVLRDSGVAVVVGLVALAATAAVVSRRRPV
jgi:hypothetical protein